MPITIITLLQWTAYITSPIFFLIFVIQNIYYLIYFLRKRFSRGKFIRIFYWSENKTLGSFLVNVGNLYSSDVIEAKNKCFMYVQSDVRYLPRGLGRISKEPCLFYNYNNIMPLTPDMKMQYKIEKNKNKNVYVPINPNLNIRKTPEEFYNVMKSKTLIDIVKAENSNKKIAMSMGMILIIAGVIFFIASQAGWI